MLIIKNKNLMSNFTDAENIIIDLIDKSIISGKEVIYLCRGIYKKEQLISSAPFVQPISYKDNSSPTII